MSSTVPAAPEFGQALPIEASSEMLRLLSRRRSASAMALRAPGPDAEELVDLLRLAARVPDHGKLSPWRFITLQGEAKAEFARRIAALAPVQANPTKASAALGKLTAPPLAVVVVSRVTPGQIPEWEQMMSAGAVCTTLLLAAQAMGYGANWITDWYAFDAQALEILGLTAGERVAGFVYIGAAAEPPQERVRPDVPAITTAWRP